MSTDNLAPGDAVPVADAMTPPAHGAAPVRPTALTVNRQGIPPYLLSLPRWVYWRYELVPGKVGEPGRWKKPLFNPQSRGPAKTNLSKTWSHVDAAIRACDEAKGDGIGLVLCADANADRTDTLYVIDADHCRDPQTGEVNAAVRDWIDRFATWTEVSPSGCGVHIWFLANLDTPFVRHGRWELYGQAQYVTVTGHTLPGCPATVERRQAVAEAFLLAEFPAPTAKPKPTTERYPGASRECGLSNESIILRCSKGPGGDLFRDLHSGGMGGQKGDSEADLSYCNRLAFYTNSVDQIVCIWRESSRWRPKCQQRINDTDYAHYTAQKAIAGRTNYYDPAFRSGKHPGMTTDVLPSPAATPASPNPPPVEVMTSTGGGFGKPPAVLPVAAPANGPQGDTGRRKVRRASDIPDESIVYFVDPLIPKGELSFIIGHPGTGKSTCLAWLTSFARACIIFPGFEGSVARMYKPRLKVHGCNMDDVYFFEEHGWTMPSSLKAVIAEVQDVGADLVLIDPIDSYMDDGVSENSAEGVRPALEAWQKVAEVTGAAVVGVRHPGKASDNPLPGSRAWRAVPRRILELRFDCGTKPRSFIHVYKSGTGEPPPDMYYRLAFAEKGKPPVFTLQEAVPSAEAELARNAGDRDERRSLDVACQFLLAALSDGEKEAGPLCKRAAEIGIATRTLYRALEKIKGEKRIEGIGGTIKGVWWLPKQQTLLPEQPLPSQP